MPKLKYQPAPASPVVSEPIKKALLSVEEFAEATNLCRTMVYKLIKQGQVHTVSVGSRRLIPATEPEAFVLRLQRGF